MVVSKAFRPDLDQAHSGMISNLPLENWALVFVSAQRTQLDNIPLQDGTYCFLIKQLLHLASDQLAKSTETLDALRYDCGSTHSSLILKRAL